MNASNEPRFAIFYAVRGQQDYLTLYAPTRAAVEQLFLEHAESAARRSGLPYAAPVIIDSWEITGDPHWSSRLNSRLG